MSSTTARKLTLRSRFARVLRITCAALLVLLIAAWIATEFRTVNYAAPCTVTRGTELIDSEVRQLRVDVVPGRVIVSRMLCRALSDRCIDDAIKTLNTGLQVTPSNQRDQSFRYVSNSDGRIVAGLGWWQMTSSVAFEARAVSIPFWLPCLLAATPLAWHFLPAHRRARRKAASLCVHCGYSRAALPDAQPCPECGHTPT